MVINSSAEPINQKKTETLNEHTVHSLIHYSWKNIIIILWKIIVKVRQSFSDFTRLLSFDLSCVSHPCCCANNFRLSSRNKIILKFSRAFFWRYLFLNWDIFLVVLMEYFLIFQIVFWGFLFLNAYEGHFFKWGFLIFNNFCFLVHILSSRFFVRNNHITMF